MAWSDPNTVQDPTTNLVAVFGWGDAVNGDFNYLRGAKAGCHLSSAVGTAIGTDTVLPWGTEDYDVNACHDNAVNTSRITVPATWGGLWFVGCQLVCTANLFTIEIVVNATTRIVGQTSNASGGVDSAVSCSSVYEMAAGDYFEVWVTNGTARAAGLFFAHFLHSDT